MAIMYVEEYNVSSDNAGESVKQWWSWWKCKAVMKLVKVERSDEDGESLKQWWSWWKFKAVMKLVKV